MHEQGAVAGGGAAADPVPEQDSTPPRTLRRASALRIAWTVWLGMLVTPFFFFLLTIALLTLDLLPRREGVGEIWFIVTLAWMAVVIPIAFFFRSWIFRSYWEGEAVAPREYMIGCIALWASIEIGGLLALLGCIVSGSLIPDIFPAVVAFVLFTPFWPSGQAMVSDVGKERDAELYRHPR